jgi:hypothetical protein
LILKKRRNGVLKDKSKADELRLLMTKSDDDVVFDIFKEEDNYQDKCLQTETEINKVFELLR